MFLSLCYLRENQLERRAHVLAFLNHCRKGQKPAKLSANSNYMFISQIILGGKVGAKDATMVINMYLSTYK